MILKLGHGLFLTDEIEKIQLWRFDTQIRATVRLTSGRTEKLKPQQTISLLNAFGLDIPEDVPEWDGSDAGHEVTRKP